MFAYLGVLFCLVYFEISNKQDACYHSGQQTSTESTGRYTKRMSFQSKVGQDLMLRNW